MLKREFKINFKSFIIWTSITIILFLLAFLIYPSILSSENPEALSEMLRSFPKEMLAMFNMDISDVNTVYGWFKTEGLTCIMLLVCLFASLLGSNILVKEESDKTIEFLYSKPINRSSIITPKLLVGTIYILISVFLIYLVNLLGMYFSDCLHFKTFTLLSMSVLLTALPIFYLTLLISTFFNKTKKTFGIGLGIVFISFFVQMISLMGDKIKWLKYFSLHTLADSRNIIETSSINYICILVSILVSIIFIILIYEKYNRKELV